MAFVDLKSHSELKSLSEVFGDDYSGTALATALMAEWGASWMNWEPAVLRAEVYEKFQVHLPDDDLNTLQAVSLLHTSDTFHTSIDGFLPVCRALSGVQVSDTHFLPAGIDEILLGCTEAHLHVGSPSFSPDIRGYCGVVLDNHGIYLPPKILEFADYPSDSDMRDERSPSRDSQFWADQKEVREVLEARGMERVRTILSEVRSLPVAVDEQFLDSMESALA